MTVKFTKKKVVRRKVEIMVPDDDDRVVKGTIWVTFEIQPRSETNRLYDAPHFLQCVKNVEGMVTDEEKPQPIEFSKERLAEWLDEDYILAGFQRAYIDITVNVGRGN